MENNEEEKEKEKNKEEEDLEITVYPKINLSLKKISLFFQYPVDRFI